MERKTFLKLLLLSLGGATMPLLSQTSKRAPAFFVGHGSPMNAILDNSFTQSLNRLGSSIEKPDAILIISAHWTPPFAGVSHHQEDALVYDMFGFPEALYTLQYPAPNADFMVEKLSQLLPEPKIIQRGLDHGVWSVLRHLYPDADVPVIQLGINRTLSMQEHFESGRALRSLRDQGIMIIGSGNITHNLHDINPDPQAKVAEWTLEFDRFIADAITRKNYSALINFQKRQRYAEHAHPTTEHYIPLLYIAGAAFDEDQSSFPYQGFEHGTLSMRNWLLRA